MEKVTNKLQAEYNNLQIAGYIKIPLYVNILPADNLLAIYFDVKNFHW